MKCFIRNVWVIICLCLASPAGACPFCKDIMEVAHANLARGFYWSILFMLAVVFAVFGVICTIIVKAQRQGHPNVPGEGK